jgi:TolA-binding protein
MKIGFRAAPGRPLPGRCGVPRTLESVFRRPLTISEPRRGGTSAPARFTVRVLATLTLCLLALAAGSCSATSPLGHYSENAFGTPKAAPSAADPAFDAAVNLVAERQYARAAEEFAVLADAYEAAARRERAAECLFWQAFCHEKLDRAAEALAEYRRVQATYPDTPAAQQAAARAARLAAATP